MYTDPGSGLFFVQVVSAAILTVVYKFRRTFARIFPGRASAKPDGKA